MELSISRARREALGSMDQRMRRLVSFCILLLIISDQAHSTVRNLDVIILAGQSNMSGRGGVKPGHWDGEVPPQDSAPPGLVLRFNRHLDWEEAREPLHRGLDSGTLGVGPGLVFAATLVRSQRVGRDTAIGLVPCAVGGTGMGRWVKGQDLYERMIGRARSALAAAGHRNRLKALLWYQGESDARGNITEAHLYRTRLESMVAGVRSDLGVKDLPVFVVGINLKSDQAQEVRRAQKAVSEEVAGVHFVDALGLPLFPDKVHLTTRGQVQVGKLLAAAYIKELPLGSKGHARTMGNG